MIVIDASAMVEALIGRDVADELLETLTDGVSAPHLLDIEVLSVPRGLLLGGNLDPAAAKEARRDHFAFAMNRYEVAPLADRICCRVAARAAPMTVPESPASRAACTASRSPVRRPRSPCGRRGSVGTARRRVPDGLSSTSKAQAR